MTITLNGREVSGNSRMTVLELAQESGVNIPTRCHDPNLTPSRCLSHLPGGKRKLGCTRGILCHPHSSGNGN
ncbi:MAG: hypothetical protein DRH54_02965 [Chloroflexi bacterium]|nr:MAG: hypothetical protein DRH54_02965 [Chloroflexota bacterium]